MGVARLRRGTKRTSRECWPTDYWPTLPSQPLRPESTTTTTLYLPLSTNQPWQRTTSYQSLEVPEHC